MQSGIVDLLTKSCLTKCQTLCEYKLLFFLLMILLPMEASADAVIEGIYEVQPTSSRTYNGNVVLYSSLENNYPNKVNYLGVSYDVTSIGNEAFSNCTDLTSVVIPNTVINIGSNAFAS